MKQGETSTGTTAPTNETAPVAPAVTTSTPPPAAPAVVEGKKDDSAVEAVTNAVDKMQTRTLMNDHQADLQIQQADPSNPLYSVKTFEELGLKEELMKGIYKMKFEKPSRIQENALPMLLKNPVTNLIAQAQSGTGKTATFVLTLLSRCDPFTPQVQGIVVAPTRELARQLEGVVKQIGSFSPHKVYLAVKDARIPKGQQVEAHIVVGTAGSILGLIQRRQMPLNNIRIIVFDEADNMLDMQGQAELSMRIVNQLPDKRRAQFALFSATYREDVRKFAEKVVPQPCNTITLAQSDLSLEGIAQYSIDCKSESEKFNVLSEIYGILTIGSSIIFINTRHNAKKLAEGMKKEGHAVSLLHGADMSSEERDKVMDDFAQGVSKVLITTNVLARGIDVSTVTLVVNFDLPVYPNGISADPETYLHRIGRGGRFGRKGVSINFIHDAQSKKFNEELEKSFGRPIKPITLDDLDALENEIKAI